MWTERVGRQRLIHRLLRCVRGCGTYRWDTYNARTMERTHRSYRYDDEYLLSGQGQTPSGDEVRSEVFSRMSRDIPERAPDEARKILGWE